MKIEAIFFDLDGTLLDTAPDLFTSITEVLNKYHYPLISYENFRPSVEVGSRGMIEHAFKITHENPKYKMILADFLEYYRDHIAQKTVFFNGIPELLSHLENRNIPWGIVTNKPEWLATPLLQHFGLEKRCQAIVCGDTLPTRKPNPAPLVHACQLVGSKPHHSAYIGDTQSDMLAAKAANMFAIAVSFGYNLYQTSPETWPADFIAHNCDDLQNWLNLM